MSLRVIHPLWSVASPSLAELLSRANTPAKHVLQTAARLAAYRFAIRGELETLRQHLQAEPWTEPAWHLPPAPRVLLPADVLRALVAEHPEFLQNNVFTRDDPHEKTWPQLVEKWRQANRDTPPFTEPLESLPLSRPWARLWARTLKQWPDMEIGLFHLLGHLTDDGIRALARCTHPHIEGLYSEKELFCHTFDAIGAALDGSDSSQPGIWMPRLTAPYFDRNSALGILEHHLVNGPGAIVVGAPGSGRTSLIAACRHRSRRGEGPSELHGWGFNIDRFYSLPYFWQPNGQERFVPPAEASTPGCIFALIRQGISAALTPSAELHREWARTFEHAIDLCLDPDARFRFIVAVDGQQRDLLYQRFPRIQKLPIITLGPIDELDLLVVWMCKVFDLEEAARGPVSLAQLLWGLSQRPNERQSDFSNLADLIAPAPRWLKHALVRARKDPYQGVMRLLRREPLARLVGDADRLTQLLEIEDALLDPQPPRQALHSP